MYNRPTDSDEYRTYGSSSTGNGMLLVWLIGGLLGLLPIVIELFIK